MTKTYELHLYETLLDMIITKEHIPDIQISDTLAQSQTPQSQASSIKLPFILPSPYSKLQKILFSPANPSSASKICLTLKDVSLTNLSQHTPSRIPFSLPISEFALKYGPA